MLILQLIVRDKLNGLGLTLVKLKFAYLSGFNIVTAEPILN